MPNLKILFKILINHVKFQLLALFFLDSVILHKSSTIAFTDTHKFGLVWPRNMNNISNESCRHPLVE